MRFDSKNFGVLKSKWIWLEFADWPDGQLSGKTLSLNGYQLGWGRRLSDAFSFWWTVGSEPRLVYRLENAQTVALERLPALFSDGQVDWKFHSGARFEGTLELGLRVYLPVHSDLYQIKSGIGYSVGAKITQKLRHLSLSAKPYLRTSGMTGSGIRFNESELGFGFEVTLPIQE
jgi:hypothetical protein